MTMNYIQELKARLVAIEDEIHVLLGLTESAMGYGEVSRDAYPYWRNIMGDYQIAGTDDGSKIRTHTAYMVWTLGAITAGSEGALEEKADRWIPTVLDYIQARPRLESVLYPNQFRWLYDQVYISAGTGVIKTTSQDTAKTTGSLTFTLIAPFRVVAQRS